MAKLFLVKAKATTQEEGKKPETKNKEVLIEGHTHTDAEASVNKYLEFYSGFMVKEINNYPYNEAHENLRNFEGYLYKVKVIFIELSDAGKLKEVSSFILVCGDTPLEALNHVSSMISDSVSDYRIHSVVETKVDDVVYLPEE